MQLTQYIKELLDSGVIPFVIGNTTMTPKVSATRILESLIIAGITAIGTSVAVSYMMTKINENNITHLEKTNNVKFDDIKQSIDRIDLTNVKWYEEMREEQSKIKNNETDIYKNLYRMDSKIDRYHSKQ